VSEPIDEKPDQNAKPVGDETPEIDREQSEAPEQTAADAAPDEPAKVAAPVSDELRLPREVLSEHALHARSRRDFLVLGAGAVGLAAAWGWVLTRPEVGGIPAPLRGMMEWNRRVSQALLGTRRMARTFPVSDAVAELRVNGDIGITQDLDLDKWRLQVFGLPNPQRFPQFSEDASGWDYGTDDGLSYGKSTNGAIPDAGSAAPDATTNANPKQPGLLLTLDDLKKLPHAETVTELKCIEGWSVIAHWGGVRMVDFLDYYGAPAMKYVGFETPDGSFYASLDMATMRHPQTLLAFELNGQPLPVLHGAPLRLATPLKYGYKQIKQVSKIFFSDVRPRDYWVENGYDWYGGH
jgi:DMSO/TMAO reductase YedYZ molybdopterin-dependent catalytic subunit